MLRLSKASLICRILGAVAIYLGVLGSSPLWADNNRVALVIGNGGYRQVPTLPNPPRDANDIADALQRMGVSVTRLIDGDLAQMNKALSDFATVAANADTAIVFYAGHGIEAAGENWLIPVDAEIAGDSDPSKQAISLHQVQKLVEKTSGLGLIILDACRDNPFAIKMAAEAPAAVFSGKPQAASRSIGHGLAPTDPTGNVLIAFSAKDGTVAEDGDGRNSPFTTALLHHIAQPGVEVTFLFRIVRDEVMKATNGAQQPFVYGSLSKESIYLEPPTGDQVLATMPTIAPETRPVNPLFSTDDAKRIASFAHDKQLSVPLFQIDAVDSDVADDFKPFLGVWVSKVGNGHGSGRQTMLIVSHIDKDGVASGYVIYGPSTKAAWFDGGSTFKAFKTHIADDTMRIQLFRQNKPYEAIFKRMDQGRFHYQVQMDGRGSSNTLYPVWRLVDAAAGKDIADADLTSPPTREELQGSKPAESKSRYGSKTGDVSNGSCRCKTLCETGTSRFSPGRSVGECKAQCEVSFSGCARGEIRSNTRRD
jgi:Caspase domain